MNSVNLYKLSSPDFLPGKVLFFLRALVGIPRVLLTHPWREGLRLAGHVLRLVPRYTMLSTRRLEKLYYLVQQLGRHRIEGDIVECGVWNGGSAAIMAAALHESPEGPARDLWLCDSFVGLPPPGEHDGTRERSWYFEGWNRGERANVEEILTHYRVSPESQHYVVGWFEETLPDIAVQNVALLHVDGDWYDSVKVVLEQLYDRVVPGGYVVLDDYGHWQGCRKAFEDFVADRGIEGIHVVPIDRTAVYFQKAAL